MTKNQELIKLKNLYKQETKEEDIAVPAFVAWLRRRGYQMPEPPTVDQVLAKQVVKALKEEVRHDDITGETYKVNVSFRLTVRETAFSGLMWMKRRERKWSKLQGNDASKLLMMPSNSN